MCHYRYSGDILGVKYSIPVKIVSNNGAMKCTIPKQIADKMNLKKGERIKWILFDDGHIEIQKEI